MWLKQKENEINYMNCHLETYLTVSGYSQRAARKEKSAFHLDRINARILKKKPRFKNNKMPIDPSNWENSRQ